MLPAVPLLFITVLLPESPRYVEDSNVLGV
jgi:hypothetical protein